MEHLNDPTIPILVIQNPSPRTSIQYVCVEWNSAGYIVGMWDNMKVKWYVGISGLNPYYEGEVEIEAKRPPKDGSDPLYFIIEDTVKMEIFDNIEWGWKIVEN